MGDPLSENTDLGPIVNASGLKTIDSQVKDSDKEGAEILTGGGQRVFLQTYNSREGFHKYACGTRSLWSMVHT